jgi:hypothetical protein
MSLEGAIQAARRRAVTSVTAPGIQTYQENPLPINEITPATAVTPQNAEIHSKSGRGLADSREAGGQGTEVQNGEVLDFEFQRNPRNQEPLSEPELAGLFTRAAQGTRLSPALLWAFLCVDDIEAIRAGSPGMIEALRAFAESRSENGDTTEGGHSLPFPGTARPADGKRKVRCGDCAHFQPDAIGDGAGIGRCGHGLEPGGGLLYPGAERRCQRFEERPASPAQSER